MNSDFEIDIKQMDVFALRAVNARGYKTVTEFLAKHPGVPFRELAKMLGPPVSALNVIWAYYGESQAFGHLRDAAMDSLVRELIHFLPGGWQNSIEPTFPQAHAYASWATHLCDGRDHLDPTAKAVWKALCDSHPPVGWLPQSVEDKLLVDAFTKEWPAG